MRETLVAGLVLSALASPALAHHSGAMYDDKKELTLTGVVKEFQYTNPHSWLFVAVTNADGSVTNWGFESEGPSTLLPHIIFSYSSEELSLADEHLATLAHPRKVAAATEFFLTGPFLLRGTSLLTILPRRLAQRLQRPADIKLIDLPFDVPAVPRAAGVEPAFQS